MVKCAKCGIDAMPAYAYRPKGAEEPISVCRACWRNHIGRTEAALAEEKARSPTLEQWS